MGGDVLDNLPVIFATLAKKKLTVCNARTVSVDQKSVNQICKEIPESAVLFDADSSGSLLAVSVNASQAVELVSELSSGLPGPVYHSVDVERAQRDIDVFFGGEKGQGKLKLNSTVKLVSGAVLAIVKPHALTEGLAGPILQGIADAGFKVTAAKLFFMDRRNAEEFFEVSSEILIRNSCLLTV